MTGFKLAGSQLIQSSPVFSKGAAQAAWRHYYLVWLVVAAFLVLEVYYTFYRFDAQRQDLNLYRQTAVNMLGGKLPYRDFAMEYPIFSLVPILITGLFSAVSGGTFQSYLFWFVIQNILLGLGMALIIARIDKSDERQAVPRFLTVMIFSFPVYLFRFDPFPAFLTIAAISQVPQKPFASGAALMASIAAKLYTIVLVPVFGLFYLFNRQWTKGFLLLAGVATMCGVILVPFIWIDAHAVSDFLHAHLLRGVQVESLSGGFLLLADQLGWVDVAMEHSYGAIHLVTDASAGVLRAINLISPVSFGLMLTYITWAFYKASRTPGGLSFNVLNAAAAIQILLFILLNKVLSPQYLIWLLPLLPFCRLRTYLVFVVIVMLTIYIFPGNYYHLEAKQLWTILVLNVRNAMLIWLFIELLAELAPGHRLAGYKFSGRKLRETSAPPIPSA